MNQQLPPALITIESHCTTARACELSGVSTTSLNKAKRERALPYTNGQWIIDNAGQEGKKNIWTVSFYPTNNCQPKFQSTDYATRLAIWTWAFIKSLDLILKNW